MRRRLVRRGAKQDVWEGQDQVPASAVSAAQPNQAQWSVEEPHGRLQWRAMACLLLLMLMLLLLPCQWTSRMPLQLIWVPGMPVAAGCEMALSPHAVNAASRSMAASRCRRTCAWCTPTWTDGRPVPPAPSTWRLMGQHWQGPAASGVSVPAAPVTPPLLMVRQCPWTQLRAGQQDSQTAGDAVRMEGAGMTAGLEAARPKRQCSLHRLLLLHLPQEACLLLVMPTLLGLQLSLRPPETTGGGAAAGNPTEATAAAQEDRQVTAMGGRTAGTETVGAGSRGMETGAVVSSSKQGTAAG